MEYEKHLNTHFVRNGIFACKICKNEPTNKILLNKQTFLFNVNIIIIMIIAKMSPKNA